MERTFQFFFAHKMTIYKIFWLLFLILNFYFYFQSLKSKTRRVLQNNNFILRNCDSSNEIRYSNVNVTVCISTSLTREIVLSLKTLCQYRAVADEQAAEIYFTALDAHREMDSRWKGSTGPRVRMLCLRTSSTAASEVYA